MKRFHLILLFVLCFDAIVSQEVYVVNSINELKIINTESLTVTDLFAIDAQQAGYITDLAFSPDGRLFGVTNAWTLLEIDVQNETYIHLADLPIGDPYTALVCNANNELLTARIFSEELYSYNLDTAEITLVDTGISTPGDFTFYKGNLVYPNILNDFIKAYDGSSTSNVGCSVSLLWTFVNQFTDCDTNIIYAFDEFAKLYRYDLETENIEEIADFFQETGILYGGATTSEYMASACPVDDLGTVLCQPLGINKYNEFGIALEFNPVTNYVQFDIKPDRALNYEIYSIQGIQVMQGKLVNETIDVTSLSIGSYFVRLFDRSQRQLFMQQIVKN